jgi:hypothetical protein
MAAGHSSNVTAILCWSSLRTGGRHAGLQLLPDDLCSHSQAGTNKAPEEASHAAALKICHR